MAEGMPRQYKKVGPNKWPQQLQISAAAAAIDLI